MTGLSDSFHRPIDYLRISVTDRCNLRCIYCMPAEGVNLIPSQEILSYEEIRTVVQATAGLGISKVRITGGEPLVRLDLPELVTMLAKIDGIDDLSLTTNGTLLARSAAGIKAAGLHRVNVSLDTLDYKRFKLITGFDRLDNVLEGIETARSIGLNPVKINMVAIAGVNDDEVLDFAAKTIDEGWHVRFIELMPVSGSEDITPRVVSTDDIKKRLGVLGELEPCLPGVGNGPASYFRFPQSKGTIGFITPVSEHFCFNCNRLRLTSDGKLRPCLLSDDEADLRQHLRSSTHTAGLKELIEKAVAGKPQHHHLAEGRIPKDRPFSQVGG